LTFLGDHTLAVQKGLNLGVILFIVSEALFFLAIFWAFFHSALTPTVELGAQWPPIGIEPVNPFELPLLNTVILLSSGATITYAHHSLIQGGRKGALYGSVATVLLAIIFTGLTYHPRILFGIAGLIKRSKNSYSSFNISSCTLFRKNTYGFCSSSIGSFNNHSLMCNSNRSYTTTTERLNLKDSGLSPFWVSGFADAESTFVLKISKGSTSRSGWNVIPEFKIELHVRDVILLRKIHSFFGVGTVSERGTRNTAIYSVQSARTIADVIIPHFDRYPLNTQKRADFLLFKRGVDLLLNGKARSSIEGIKNIVSIRASMNNGLTDTLKINFPNIIPVPRPIVSFDGIPDLNWLAGFVDGEGYFYVKSIQSSKYSSGYSVSLVFSVSQHVRDEGLLTKFIEYLGCGKIERASTRPDSVNFTVYRFNDIKDKIIPLFLNHPLQGIKYRDFCDFSEVVNIMETKGHFTPEGLKRINSLKSGMNNQRENK